MDRIDAHQHFWQFDPVKDSWITTGMEKIQRDFMPVDLQPVLADNAMDGCIAVQASQTEAETTFLLSLARRHPFIKGVVGWVDLKAPGLETKLAHFAGDTILKGFRHILQGENLGSFLADGKFDKGLSLLKRHGFSYDLLVFHAQIKSIIPLVQKHPDQVFILDHLGKPDLKSGVLTQWIKDIQQLSIYQNVYCKISGLVTEADWQHWQPAQLLPCLDTCVEAFGTNRIMFGSDWPVCLLAATYQDWQEFLLQYFSTYTTGEKADFFGGNAVRAYGLDLTT